MNKEILKQMLPRLIGDNAIDRCITHMKHSCQLCLQMFSVGPQASYFCNVLLGKFGSSFVASMKRYRAMKMFPATATANVSYICIGYSIPSSKIYSKFSCLSSISDGEYLGFSKFMRWRAFPFVVRAVLGPVSLVVQSCIPAKIIKAIIEWIVVIMAAFHSIWTRANKSFKDKSMDKTRARHSISPQNNPIARLPSKQQFEVIRLFKRVLKRAYTAKITNLIAGGIGDVFPQFFCGRMSVHSEPPIRCAKPRDVSSIAVVSYCQLYPNLPLTASMKGE